MRLVWALTLVGVVVAGDLSVFTHGKKNHYHEVSRLIKPTLKQQDSLRLTEIETHLGLQNPMITIYQTCQLMHSEAKAEQKKVMADDAADAKFCQKTIAEYDEAVKQSRAREERLEEQISKLRTVAQNLWKDQEGTRRKIFSTNYAKLWANFKTVFPGNLKSSIKTCKGKAFNWVIYVSTREKDFKIHNEYLVSRKAFEFAIAQMRLLYRILNGEGSLNDLEGHTHEGGSSYNGDRHTTGVFISEMAKHADVKSVPNVASMLEVFGKTVTKMTTKPVPADMDAINTVIAKIQKALAEGLKNLDVTEDDRENLMQDDLKSTENCMRLELDRMWGSPVERSFKKSAASRLPAPSAMENFYTSYINKIACNSRDGIRNDQCPNDSGAGNHWNLMARKEIKRFKKMKSRARHEILREFLNNRCIKSRRDNTYALTTLANEIKALSDVMKYLEKCCVEKMEGAQTEYKSKYGQKMDAVMSTPYKWVTSGPNKPAYVAVKNTYSTVDNANDKVACETMYATVFSQVRVLTLQQLNSTAPPQKYLDPNDLTHSKNFQTDGITKLKNGVQCQLFPNGIPVGRAHSCDKKATTRAMIDLTGTPYRFPKSSVKFFKVLGRYTNAKATGQNAPVQLSGDQRKITLMVSGRCGDVYGDDSANADYRSDPIPLELAPAVGVDNSNTTAAAPAPAPAAPAPAPAPAPAGF